jgi:hypothetical protein
VSYWPLVPGAKTKKEAVNLALQFYADKQESGYLPAGRMPPGLPDPRLPRRLSRKPRQQQQHIG